MDILDLKKTILTNSSEREGARLLDSLAKSIILANKGEDGAKLKETYFDMCRKSALKVLEEEGTTGAKALIEIEKLEIEISKAKIEVLEKELKEKEETQQKDTNNNTENSESDNKEIKKEKYVKIGNLMIGERGSGKTAELLKMSAKNQVYILTSNLQRVFSLANLADDMKLNIPFPISLPEAINGKLKGSYIKELYIDDVEGVLYELLGVKIKAMTITTKDKDDICRLWSDTKPLFKEIEDKLQQFYFKESDFVHKQEIYSKVRFESPGDTVSIEIISDLLKIFNIKGKPIRAIVTIGGSYMLPRILVTLEENKQVFLNYFDTVYIINKINNMFHEIRTLIFCILNSIDNFGIQAPLIAHISLPVR